MRVPLTFERPVPRRLVNVLLLRVKFVVPKLVVVALVKRPVAEKTGILNSKRSEVAFQVKSAFGEELPRLKMRVLSSVSAVALSALTVNELETVPAIEVDAAERLLTVSSSIYPRRQ